jgi:8-oxo-dGTP pyrophosphatase MutT (NUDIX family)
VRFDEAASLLSGPLPARLPPPPHALVPVLTTTGRRRDDALAPPGPPREAAVLVLVVPGPAGEALVVLTERVDRGGHHSGEVSLPGGSAEPGDVDPAATALREAHEEIGLDASTAGVRIVGRLEPFTIPVSGYHVTPIVALAARHPEWIPAPDEVARVVEAPLDAFLPGAPIVVVHEEVRGWPLRYGAYPVDDLLVWGATARILGQLGAFIGSQPGGEPAATDPQRGSPSSGS